MITTNAKIEKGRPSRVSRVVAALVTLLLISSASGGPVVEVEETVYSFTPANNGAGPMWCHGSTCLARVGDRLFATGLETLEGVAPLNNCRWTLLERTGEGWVVRYRDDGRTREPAPLAALSGGSLWVSANPTLAPQSPQPQGGPAQPSLVEFRADAPTTPAATVKPVWQGAPSFTEHSYRSLAADGGAGELLLFQNVGYTHAEWAFRDRAGRWTAQGQLKWPWGADYEEPQPIRVCYPNVALRGRAAHFFGVSDIQEPRREWRQFKKELTGQHWDYDFRRLFYTWSPDVSQEPFRPWIEIASREATAGSTSVGDLYLAPDGAVHLLWTERAIDERLRDRFFPQAQQAHSLNHAVVREGAVIQRRVLVESSEARPGVIPSAARFQPAPDGRLWVCYFAGGRDERGQSLSENRVIELRSDGSVSSPQAIPLKQPFTIYFTATPRAGSPPAAYLEMLGIQSGAPNTLRYARVRL